MDNIDMLRLQTTVMKQIYGIKKEIAEADKRGCFVMKEEICNKKTNCKNCGAPLYKSKCEYCGIIN